MALKNKQELEAKSKSKSKKSHDRKSSNETLLHYENEINKELLPLTHSGSIGNSDKTTDTHTTTSILKNNDHRKQRKHRNVSNSDGYSTTSSSSSKKSSHQHYATKDLRIKRPSIRQKLFRQTGIYHMPTAPCATQSLVQAVINTPVPQCSAPRIESGIPVLPAIHCVPPAASLLERKRKRLQRLNTLNVPTMVRMGSVP